jgi:glycosidase
VFRPLRWSHGSLLVAVSAAGCGTDGLLSASESSASDSSEGGGEGDERQGFVAHYFSAWNQAYMHFDDGGGWTTAPGLPMTPAEGGWYDLEHAEGTSVVFAFNDGDALWDNQGEQNYATDLYEFWVKDGVIHPERPDDGDTVDTPFCEEVDCGKGGMCNEAEARCDCNEGFIFDAGAMTCVGDLCAEVDCAFGELCESAGGTCQAACEPDRTVGDFSFCAQKTDTAVGMIVQYQGAGQLDLAASTIRLNDAEVDEAAVEVDEATGALALTAGGLPASKYSWLLRMRNDAGEDVRPLFVPQWIGAGTRYADFQWKDGIMYQIMTDRFLDGDPSNNIVNSKGSLAEVDDPRSQWQGGDFRGIIDKLEDGYFEEMGINTLWISSPLLNSHNSQPAVGLSDDRRFASYHSYHPVVTGYTHLDDFGYDNPIETAFGTPEELHELVRKAHARGIRVIPDFVANHVHSEAEIFDIHQDWFFAYNPCDNNWDAHRIDCWFTTDMPDFDYFGNPQAVEVVVDHALWMIQEFNFDGFRADALKHMDDTFVRALKTAVVEEIETTVNDHALSNEATIFYMVGESLGGWARYHVRLDMVQGQVDEEYYRRTKNALLTYGDSLSYLASFAIPNDRAYLVPQANNGGVGGYPGAVMGNFFGNHDQVRALTEANGDHARLRLAQTFLFTSPGNIPMLYQGDDIGTFGGPDPDNRAMQRFEGLSGDEQASLAHAQRVGRLRDEHPALRRGTRETVEVEDYFWVYRAEHEGDVVYVAINRDEDKSWDPPAGFVDALGNCDGGNVPSQRSCVFVEQ